MQANPQYRQFFATHQAIWTPEFLQQSQGSLQHHQLQTALIAQHSLDQDGVAPGSRSSTWVFQSPSPRLREDVDEEPAGTQLYSPSPYVPLCPPLLSGESGHTSYVAALVSVGPCSF